MNRHRSSKPFHTAIRLRSKTAKGGVRMFGALYDKAEWAVGLLLIVAIVAAMFV